MSKLIQLKLFSLFLVITSLSAICFSPALGWDIPLTDKGIAPLPFNCDFRTCVGIFGEEAGGDFVYYMRSALMVYEAGGFQNIQNLDQNLWIFRLWPAGMPYVYLTIFRFTQGLEIFVPVYISIVVMVWSIAFGVVIFLAKTIKRLAVIWVFIIALLLSPMFRFSIFGNSIYYSEALSYGFFFIAIVSFYLGFSEKKLSKQLTLVALSAVSFSISAYLRSVFDGVGIISAIFFILTSLFVSLWYLLQKLKSKREKTSFTHRSMFLMPILWAATFAAMTAPWRQIIHEKVSPGSWSFAPGAITSWANGWLPTELWSDKAFPNTFGINGFCRVYTSKCLEIYELEKNSGSPYSGYGAHTFDEFRNLALQEILMNPFPWLQSRFNFAISQSLGSLASNILGLLLFLSISLLLIFSFANLIHFIRARNFKTAWVVSVMFLWGTLTIVPLTFLSFEPRYFFPFYISIWVAGILLISRPLPPEFQLKLVAIKLNKRLRRGLNDQN